MGLTLLKIFLVWMSKLTEYQTEIKLDFFNNKFTQKKKSFSSISS